MAEGTLVGRRRFLALAASASVALISPEVLAAPMRVAPARALAFENLHTGERVKSVYWANGRYVPSGLREIDHILRDFRTGETVPIDRDLLDTLLALQEKLHTTAPFQVISGYRSQRTNAMLVRATRGVVRDSLHTEAMAIDIRVPGRSLRDVQRAAMSLEAGGVGYYPRSGFVHVDVGRVRYW
jgi:uncharacterized protein YcbK (DUF882 family)